MLANSMAQMMALWSKSRIRNFGKHWHLVSRMSQDKHESHLVVMLLICVWKSTLRNAGVKPSLHKSQVLNPKNCPHRQVSLEHEVKKLRFNRLDQISLKGIFQKQKSSYRNKCFLFSKLKATRPEFQSFGFSGFPHLLQCQQSLWNPLYLYTSYVADLEMKSSEHIYEENCVQFGQHCIPQQLQRVNCFVFKKNIWHRHGNCTFHSTNSH